MAEIVPKNGRLESLDALRGFDMLWIIGGGEVIHNLARTSNSVFLNTLSNQMTHVHWEGFHFYDLIMPLFLFMAGMSIPFSIEKRLRLGESKKKIYMHALMRCIILIILGMIYEGNLLAFDIQYIFLGSVLGSIGIGFFFSTIIYTQLTFRNQIWLTAGLLAAFWSILTFVPVPGQQAGLLLPESNIVKYVENMVFGEFAKPGVRYMWLLDTVGFICTVMTGVLASTIIRGNFKLTFVKDLDGQIHKTHILALTGIILVFSSLVLSIWFPVIKNIWNPTFVLLTSGLSLLLIAIFYFVIDVKGYKRWAFWLKVIGMNSITVYLGVHFISFSKLANSFVFGLEQFTDTYYPVIQSLTALIIIYIILYWMYRKRTFIRI
jgi:predicted acyltransferase